MLIILECNRSNIILRLKMGLIEKNIRLIIIYTNFDLINFRNLYLSDKNLLYLKDSFENYVNKLKI